jgi:quercetin dioxygenase-like cupin family protein
LGSAANEKGQKMNEKPKTSATEPIDLIASVEYAEDSIVSKTLTDHKSGSLTLFAFDAGQSLSEHTSPFEAVVQILEGESLWTVGGKVHAVTSGQLIVLPPSVPHGVTAKRRFKMLLTMIRP